MGGGCGAAEIAQAGRYGLLACYADDPNTPEDEGAAPGDTIRLTVAGEMLAEGVWTGNGEREYLTLGQWQSSDLYLPLISQGAGNAEVPENDSPENSLPENSLPENRLWLPTIEGSEGPVSL